MNEDYSNSELSKPMSVLRILYRKRNLVLVSLILFTLLLVILNLYFTNNLIDKKDNCNEPCFGTMCRPCVTVAHRIPTVNVLHHLRLKVAAAADSAFSSNRSSSSDLLCKRPAFDLNHDSVKHAFFPMKALNCSRTELFSIQNGVFVMDEKKIPPDQEIEKCSYLGIVRVSDDYSTYTEPHVKDKGPFSPVIKQDFVRIKCYLKSQDNESSKEVVLDSIKDEKSSVQLNHTLNQQRNGTVISFQKNSSKAFTYKKAENTSDPFLLTGKESQHADEVQIPVKLKDLHQNKNISHILPMDIHNGSSYRKSHLQKLHKSSYYIPSNNSNIQKNITGISHTIKNLKIAKNLSLQDPYDDGQKRFLKVNKKFNKMPGHHNRQLLQSDYANEIDTPDEPAENQDEEYTEDRYGMYDTYPFAPQPTPDFDQLLVQVYPRADVFERISSLLHKHDANFPQMNVLMIGLDSMSHLAYQRKLPKTYNYLKDELGAVILNGYNIVGDATTAALIPMLTGKVETELPEVRRNQFDSETVDVYPLIWKQFQKKGYVTLFAEDEPSIGAFNLRLNGFDKPPTDHYMRPFWQALWETELRQESPKFCTGNVPNHMYLLNYAKDFFIKYANVSKFAFVFGSELTHWDNNPGEYIDEDLVNFLKFLKTKRHLDNTVLVVMGDHGARYSRVRKTVQGKMEERLPLMSFAMPKNFRKKFPLLFRTLQKNSERLVTPFDIHETLLDILSLKRTTSYSPDYTTKRGISLLRPIPSNRTCSAAGIQMHWCTCLQEYSLDVGDSRVLKAAHTLLQFINKETLKVRSLCAKLQVRKIIHANLLVPNEQVLMFQKTQDADQRVANFSEHINLDHTHFQITMETTPNHGVYEGTIQVNTTSGSFTVIEQDISRIDRYGNQPLCVQDKHPELRKYCYCIDGSDAGNQTG